jgi:hypothetical protein
MSLLLGRRVVMSGPHPLQKQGIGIIIDPLPVPQLPVNPIVAQGDGQKAGYLQHNDAAD